MTEDEAKTKWCPFAKAVTGVRSSDGSIIKATSPHNRVGIVGETSPAFTHAHECIASACMAWRGLGYLTNNQRHGYCGLAGPGAPE